MWRGSGSSSPLLPTSALGERQPVCWCLHQALENMLGDATSPFSMVSMDVLIPEELLNKLVGEVFREPSCLNESNQHSHTDTR